MEKENNVTRNRIIFCILVLLIILESIFLYNLKKETQELYFVQSQEGRFV